MPKVTISNKEEIDEIRGKILCSAERTVGEIRRMVDADPTPIEVLRQIKFAPGFGFHPVKDQRLNLIEQVNQTFTCLVSLAAASEIMRRHPDCLPLHLNMGTNAGSDIQSDDKTVAAEVFAAVRRTNNSSSPRTLPGWQEPRLSTSTCSSSAQANRPVLSIFEA